MYQPEFTHYSTEQTYTGSRNTNSTALQKPELEFLRELISARGPEKILAVEVSDDILSAIRDFAQGFRVPCQIEQCGISALTECLATMGVGIDILILNSVCNMPVELLNFIVAVPYLKQDAIVILQDAILKEPITGRLFASSGLFQTVTAEKFPHNLEYYLDFNRRVGLGKPAVGYPQYSSIYRSAYIQFPIVAAFQLNKNTRRYIGGIFAALRVVWQFVPAKKYLSIYETEIAKHYDREFLQLYQQAVEVAEQFFNPSQLFLGDIADSLFGTFRHILLYGKGNWGQRFLKISKKLNIKVTGFVVSDGHTTTECMGLPVYLFSQIPFDTEETLIIQTANSGAVELALRQSKWHWMKLPESFWIERGGD